MIKILEQDTIVDIVNKINNCNDVELILEFPFSHPVLHNYMSLKILKSKAGTKRITIVTADIISKKIGNSLGINYSIVKDSNYIKEKNSKQELLKHNFGFFEYLIYELKKYYTRFLNFIGKKTGIKGLKYYNPYDKVKNSGLFFLIIGLFTSIGMLLFIFYFAVNKTYINISPEIKIKTDAINIIYEENANLSQTNSISDDLVVNLKKVTESFSGSYTQKSSGIEYEMTNKAVAEVTFINYLRDEQIYRPKTRLVDENGILFETNEWISIPGISYNSSGALEPGKLVTTVTAKTYDTNGEFIGSRGNISTGTFLLPGLVYNQDKVYAELNKPATGGNDNVTYIVSQEDIDNAQKILEEQLKKEVLDKLKAQISGDNIKNNTTYEILGIDNIIKYSDININFENPDIKVGDKITSFTLNGSINVTTYVYNKNNVVNIMSNIINEKLLAGTDKLLFIDENSLRLPLVLEEYSQEPFKVKATTEIDSGISYDFDNNSNYSNQRLKVQILGLDNNDAINILLNDTNISNVTIKNTPFFIKKVSTNIDNVLMKIVQ